MTTNSAKTENFLENTENASNKTHKKGFSRSEKIIGGLFLGSLTSFSLLAGFGVTLSSARKQDPESFAKGLISFSDKGLAESGGTLALRALGKATLYTVGTFGLLTFIVAKTMGVSSIHEFYVKVDAFVPKFKKKEPTGRQEFDSIRELFEYIIDEDEKAKNDKNK
ncbi:hypothetical protein LOTGIDRAFT_183804 [Lottia gigantea]|uniref:Transmembrane protein 242 n=1 Tax=Lottia gigantea TaxID=225164 RepID=V3ZWT9_LOTGI|nr:hypothetical protein LOTGIDRAFT_183804 [Lottia gigantea]ESO85401.1 hypothetical protein LOTGIDRAFT_183804 [Lottia gigantea]